MAGFIWYDVMTTDTAAATRFYQHVFGWQAADSGVPGQDYTVLSKDGAMVGGLMAVPPDAAAMGVPPCWMGYIHVDDVDAMAARVEAAGGRVMKPGEDIPTIGRFAVVADPHGAGFLLFSPLPPPPEAAAACRQPAPGEPGTVGWRELQAGNLDAAWAFYAGLFGWTKAEAIDIGPMGIYQLFATDGAMPAGGMMTKVPEAPAPFWLYYFNVAAIDAAVARVGAGGGKVAHGPMQVPGGQWIAQCFDPQGAMFGMVAPHR